MKIDVDLLLGLSIALVMLGVFAVLVALAYAIIFMGVMGG